MSVFRVKLHDKETGEEGWHEEQVDASTFDARDTLGFYWTDGNAGCDCERARMLAAAHGKADPNNVSCGNSRIVIVEATINGEPFNDVVDKR